MESEPPMFLEGPSHGSVRLLLSGVTSGAVVKVEPATVAAVEVRAHQLHSEVPELKRKIWLLGREKGNLIRQCEVSVRALKENFKEKSRDALKELQAACRSAEEANRELKRAKIDTKYFRKRMYEMLEENTQLIIDLKEAVQLNKNSQRDASRAQAAQRASTSACTLAKGAYRERATQLTQLSKEVKSQRVKISYLEKLNQTSDKGADAEREKADAAMQRLRASEARVQQLQAECNSMEANMAERDVECAAQTFVGEHLLETNKQLVAEIGTKDSALEAARDQIEKLRDIVAKLQVPSMVKRIDDAAGRTQRLYQKQDLDYLTNIFNERKWPAKILAKALAQSGLIKDVFESQECWEMRIQWLKDEMHLLRTKQWSVEATIGLMIDAVMSYGDLQRLRQAFSLEYSAEHDRAMHRTWVVSPHLCDENGEQASDEQAWCMRRHIVRMPEPIPPVEKVRQKFKEYEGSLKITVSDDGKIATHRFMHRLVELHEEHKALGLIHPSCGTSEALAHVVTYCLDGFPVEALSVEHAGILSSSLKVPSQSEEFFRIVTAATIKECNAELNRMHTLRRIDKDFNLVSTRGTAKASDGSDIYFILVLCMDKKAIEVLRGVAPGCPWCTCPREKRLATAWRTDNEPTSWQAALAALKKVCSGAFAFPQIHDMYEWAHLALPGEALPRYCHVCKKKPYKTVAEYEAGLKAVAAKRCDTSKEGKNIWKRERSNHGAAHFSQYLHEAPNLMFNMLNVIPEIMHLDALNVAKQAWTKGLATLLNEHMREVLTGFIKGLGGKLDVKAKPDGRSGTAWFKASMWAELVHGSDKVPAGLPAWLATVLYIRRLRLCGEAVSLHPQATPCRSKHAGDPTGCIWQQRPTTLGVRATL